MELGTLCSSVKQLFNISSIDELGKNLLENLSNNEVLDSFCKMVDNDLSKDWLQMIFQYYEADRVEKKQDYTPKSLARLIARIAKGQNEITDMCAGSGALTIQCWNENPNAKFTLYELDEAVIPYLLFNLVIRNIDATVYRSNILTKEIFETYRIEKSDKFGKVVFENGNK